MINLISDTVTKPTKAMLEYMMQAEVGDDVFNQDPSINKLQDYAADLFGHEAALFCPSGTMCNQIAIKVHTQPMDEIICNEMSHVYQYENGGFASLSGVSIKFVGGNDGKISAESVQKAIQPDFDWLPKTSLVCLENTNNKAGGNTYELEEIKSISTTCKENGLKFHLDGARIFNAIVEKNYTPKQLGEHFDSISICLSKGLGAPVGSLLIGSKAFIKQARRVRKAIGGGMRQAGFLAAAGYYALTNHVERLKEDHIKAQKLSKTLQNCDFVESVRPVSTNIVIFDLKNHPSEWLLEQLEAKNILAVPFGPNTIRFTTHLDVSNEMIDEVCAVLRTIK